jgi:hypothetical protein
MRTTLNFKYLMLLGMAFFALTACTNSSKQVVDAVKPDPIAPIEQPGPVVTPEPEISTGLPCTLENQAPTLIARTGQNDQLWDGPQRITAESLGMTTIDRVHVTQVLQDDLGNTFVTGWLEERTATQTQTSSVYFIVKYGQKGTREWSKRIDTKDFSSAANKLYARMALDQQGNMYLTASTFFIPADDPTAPPTQHRAWLRKLDPDGKSVWTRAFDSGLYGASIMVDATGHFWTLSSPLRSTANPSNDLKLRRYDPNGQCHVEHEIKLEANQVGYSLASDNQGFVYLIRNADTANPTPSDQASKEPSVMKFNWKAELQWSRHLSPDWTKTPEQESGTNLVRIVDDSIYTTTVMKQKDEMPARIYLTRYDLNAKPLWTRDIGSAKTQLSGVGYYQMVNFSVLENGDPVFIVMYSGYYPNCCKSVPGWEYYVSHLDKNGTKLMERRFGDQRYHSVWADPPGNLIMRISGFWSDDLIVEQHDPLVATK